MNETEYPFMVLGVVIGCLMSPILIRYAWETGKGGAWGFALSNTLLTVALVVLWEILERRGQDEAE